MGVVIDWEHWRTTVQVFHCQSAEDHIDHASHFWLPSFITPDDEQTGIPEFVCGGYPRTLFDIEEARDRH